MSDTLFYVTQITKTPLDDGYCISCSTDVPCHLWMRWTYNQPWKHPVPRIVRGLPIDGDMYYCVTAFNDIEQIQAGDTLVHTFQWKHKTVWEGAYIYFSGTINGEPSPSTSAIDHLRAGQDVPFYNLSFDTWPDPDLLPDFWTKYYWGTGWSKWHRSTDIPYGRGYSARLEAGGYARGTGLRQVQDATPFLFQPLKFTAWGKGYAYANNDFTVAVDGTGGWTKHAQISDGADWKKYEILGTIPGNATLLYISARCYSPGYGPVFTYWDKIEISTVL